MNTEEEKRSPLLALPGWDGLRREIRHFPGYPSAPAADEGLGHEKKVKKKKKGKGKNIRKRGKANL